jgi:hypothetical protein
MRDNCFPFNDDSTPLRRPWALRLLALSTSFWLGACSSTPAADTPAPPPPPPPVASPTVTAAPAPAEPPPAQPREERLQPAEQATGAPETVLGLLLYAERLRGLSSAELTQELGPPIEVNTDPARQLKVVLVLMQLRQPTGAARAQGLLQRFVAQPGPEFTPLKPLARLLQAVLADQRRLEETMDRQAQQLREAQRRLEALNERLDAMRDIERSLMPRGPAAGPARSPAP